MAVFPNDSGAPTQSQPSVLNMILSTLLEVKDAVTDNIWGCAQVFWKCGQPGNIELTEEFSGDEAKCPLLSYSYGKENSNPLWSRISHQPYKRKRSVNLVQNQIKSCMKKQEPNQKQEEPQFEHRLILEPLKSSLKKNSSEREMLSSKHVRFSQSLIEVFEIECRKRVRFQKIQTLLFKNEEPTIEISLILSSIAKEENDDL